MNGLFKRGGAWGVFFIVFLLAACGGAGSHSVPDALSVKPGHIYLLPLQSLTPKVQFTDASGATRASLGPINWRVADTSVATVDDFGLLTGKHVGKTTLTVETEGLTVDIPVTVTTSATVTGRVRYEDRRYDKNGLQSSQFLPVRRAKVEVLGNDNVVISATVTGEDGRFRFEIFSEMGFRIRVLAETVDSADFMFSVRDVQSQIYAAAKNNLAAPLEGLTVDMDIPVNSAAGAFNILDVYTHAAEFVKSFEPRSLGTLNVYWHTQLAGTYFCTGYISSECNRGKGIYVLQEVPLPLGTGALGDNDEYDDDVLWHEFGHYLIDSFSRDDSHGGMHNFLSTALDMRLAFSEGWGDYFPIVLKTWLSQRQQTDGLQRLSTDMLSAYIDTIYTGSGSEVSNKMDLASLKTNTQIHNTNEVAIAKVLYEFTQIEGMALIWPIFSQYFVDRKDATDLDAFWDGWRATRNPDTTKIRFMQGILAERQIYYQQDSFEAAADDALSSSSAHVFTVCPSTSLTSGDSANCGERHTLYREDNNADVDVIALNLNAGMPYLLQTTRLINGANTSLTLFDDMGRFQRGEGPKSSMSTSAYLNSENNFASQLEFTPTVSGLYYARIAVPVSPAAGTGRYGTYYFSAKAGALR